MSGNPTNQDLASLAGHVFPSEKYGLAQREDEHKGSTRACVHSTDTTKPIGRWKEAWEAAKIRAGVQSRLHDLRHTGCTRMLEAGVPFSGIATIQREHNRTNGEAVRAYRAECSAARRRCTLPVCFCG